MDYFTLNLKKDDLQSLMKDFHLLTGIKIALFDKTGNEILSYPEAHCPFCSAIRSSVLGEEACLTSNNRSFTRCRNRKTLEIFHCHAGLVEATAPLIDNGAIIGYIMFGQITDEPEREFIEEHLKEILKLYLPDSDNSEKQKELLSSVSAKSREQIEAASKILEACTFYVLLKDIVSLRRVTFIQNLDSFLNTHLSEDLSVERLLTEFNISKTKLYEACSLYLNTGVAEHIRTLRIEKAKSLLKETDLPVKDISDRVGFNDYNYFCRVFKQETGISAGKYRKEG